MRQSGDRPSSKHGHDYEPNIIHVEREICIGCRPAVLIAVRRKHLISHVTKLFKDTFDINLNLEQVAYEDFSTFVIVLSAGERR